MGDRGDGGLGGILTKGADAGIGGAAATGGAGVDSGTGGSGAEEPTCAVEVMADAPIRRLSRFEYNNTVRDVLGDSTRPAAALPFDGLPDGPSRVPDSEVSAALIQGYHKLARDFALRVTTDQAALDDLVPCDPASDGEETCRDAFISEWVGRLFRRPATADEIEEFAAVFETGQSLGGDFASGVRAVIQVGLQSPEFLYRPEVGEGSEDAASARMRPTSYEMASRLSYLLWGSAPDQALLEAASRDELNTKEQIEKQARRLLNDSRAGDAVGHFYLRLLRAFDAEMPAVLDPAFPSFTPEIAALMLKETRAFTADLTLSGEGDFDALWNAPHTFVNGPLAAHYGIEDIAGSEFQRAALDPERRAGLLTQGSFLATTARGRFTNPSRRGAIILTSLLCAEIPFDLLETERPPPKPLPANTTTRVRLQQEVGPPECNSCHG